MGSIYFEAGLLDQASKLFEEALRISREVGETSRRRLARNSRPDPAAALTNVYRKEMTMILVRNVFQLKFGKAREAVAIIKDGIAIQKKLGSEVSMRLLTDITGQFYTLVLELTVPSLAALETTQPRIMGDKDWQANYQKFVPLVESGHREIFTIVE
jgi:hypothetical protein